MSYIFDWLLIVLGSYFLVKAYKRICFEKNCSVANIIICVVYVFCVLPILFNYIVGKPKYLSLYWYKAFLAPMNNPIITIIYDIYILFSLSLLYIYSAKFKPRDVSYDKFLFINNKLFSKLIILSPYIYIIINGTLKNYLIYNTTSLRGFGNINTSYFTILNALIFLSLFTSYSNFFKQVKKSGLTYIIFIIYNLSIIWIVGKRYIIANIILTIIYYLSQSELSLKVRRKIYKLTPIFIIILFVFSAFYLISVKTLSDTSTINVYEMLRVDFGRDDVIKYTIDQELIKNNRILEYRGESFLSAILVLIPRRIWPQKPYPHYMYLTASILHTNIFKLPAGTTPSWYEMCISNFDIVGMFIACFGLLLLCKISDKSKNVDVKYIWLLFIVVLLTQGIEVYAIYIVLIFMLNFAQLFKKKKRRDINDMKDLKKCRKNESVL